ncbi:phosphoribosyltransferase family protein [Niallia sp. 01092]|uniref:phosphoribosyltransferase family protein n=1 Tax=unclassified Niallia TaxID=2837522 RepID=UPI003FD3C636
MKNLHTLTYLNKKILLPIIDELKMEIEIEENPFQLPIEDFFSMAARINKKRSFLFVSKLLGKHIPIDPKTGLLTGFLLAARYVEVMTEKKSLKRAELLNYYPHFLSDFKDTSFVNKEISSPVIIGFAETATALGHSFYQAFKDAAFFHTTRENVNEVSSVISFEEEHSHATSHRCYVDESLLHNNREVILVDDELTTGNTAINIIRAIQKKYPRKKYTVVSILDWRSAEQEKAMAELEEELGINVHFVSLLKGTFKLHEGNGYSLTHSSAKTHSEWQDHAIQIEYVDLTEFTADRIIPFTSCTCSGERNTCHYLLDTGRFGIETNQTDDQWIKKAGYYLSSKKKAEKTLIVGTGEFMYIPMKIASYMGENIYYQSTTRSPIYANDEAHYGVKTAFTFPNPEDQHIVNHLYNLEAHPYEEVFILFERKVDSDKIQQLINIFKETSIKKINIVYCFGG